jgi:hypothetical protein
MQIVKFLGAADELSKIWVQARVVNEEAELFDIDDNFAIPGCS